VISDGDPTDEGDHERFRNTIFAEIEGQNLTIISCYITK